MVRGISIPGGPKLPPQYRPGGTVDPTKRAAGTQYRQDAGADQTDSQYNAWLNSRQGGLAGLQEKTNIGTDAQKALAQQQQDFGQSNMSYGANLQAGAERRRMDMFTPWLDKLGSQFSQFSGAGGAGGNVPQVPQVQDNSGAEDAARRAAFARAKDQAGLIGRSAMTGLNQAMGARGIAGSKFAHNQAGGVINQQANQLGEFNREQAIQELDNIRKRASEAYQGGITQRGQDVSMRGQDLSADLARKQMIASLMGQFPGNITARY